MERRNGTPTSHEGRNAGPYRLEANGEGKGHRLIPTETRNGLPEHRPYRPGHQAEADRQAAVLAEVAAAKARAAELAAMEARAAELAVEQ
jgi:regulator of protease activity HflC (stomatin/prohibitin superfamily)